MAWWDRHIGRVDTRSFLQYLSRVDPAQHRKHDKDPDTEPSRATDPHSARERGHPAPVFDILTAATFTPPHTDLPCSVVELVRAARPTANARHHLRLALVPPLSTRVTFVAFSVD